MADRWVCLDVGETLIDETRIWSTWADVLGLPRLTFLSALGAAVARGRDHRAVFTLIGRPDWRSLMAEVEARYGGFAAADLYPDALPAMSALRAAGYRVAVIANQPVSRTAQLRSIGVDPEVMAMSDEIGAWKPQPEFFARALELMDQPYANDVAYVGDRLDNDVLPSAAAGMRPVWLRRGPWGYIEDEAAPPGTLVVDSLAELVQRIEECWS